MKFGRQWYSSRFFYLTISKLGYIRAYNLLELIHIFSYFFFDLKAANDGLLIPFFNILIEK